MVVHTLTCAIACLPWSAAGVIVQVYLSRGYGLRNLLTARRTDTMIDRIKPKLRRGDYDGAMLSAVELIKGFVKEGPEGWWESGMGIVVFVLLGFGIVVGLRWREERRREAEDRRRRREWEECRRKLERIAREREARAAQLGGGEASGEEEDDGMPPPESCPVCLEVRGCRGAGGRKGGRELMEVC